VPRAAGSAGAPVTLNELMQGLRQPVLLLPAAAGQQTPMMLLLPKGTDPAGLGIGRGAVPVPLQGAAAAAAAGRVTGAGGAGAPGTGNSQGSSGAAAVSACTVCACVADDMIRGGGANKMTHALHACATAAPDGFMR
jgi:hypothetical protein